MDSRLPFISPQTGPLEFKSKEEEQKFWKMIIEALDEMEKEKLRRCDYGGNSLWGACMKEATRFFVRKDVSYRLCDEHSFNSPENEVTEEEYISAQVVDS